MTGKSRPCHITQAAATAQIAAVRALFEDYAAWIGIDLDFQGFKEELASLPGLYAPPRGRLLLAALNDGAAGCVALRPLGDGVCEMKRLFVRPACQGRSLGKQLARRVVGEAKAIGYERMVLDTLPFMHSALRLYAELGFVACSAYYDTPRRDTLFMELRL